MPGLLSRARFEELLGTELERSRHTAEPFPLLVGSISDGEATAQALEVVARDLHRWTRSSDSSAQIGPAGFAVLLPETSREVAVLVAHRLVRAARRSLAEELVSATVSIGLAPAPANGQRADNLIDAAVEASAAPRSAGAAIA